MPVLILNGVYSVVCALALAFGPGHHSAGQPEAIHASPERPSEAIPDPRLPPTLGELHYRRDDRPMGSRR